MAAAKAWVEWACDDPMRMCGEGERVQRGWKVWVRMSNKIRAPALGHAQKAIRTLDFAEATCSQRPLEGILANPHGLLWPGCRWHRPRGCGGPLVHHGWGDHDRKRSEGALGSSVDERGWL